MKAIIRVTVVGVLVMAVMGCATVKNGQYLTAEQVISALKLEPMNDAACPGFFKPTYASGIRAHMDKERAAASLIYYLMTKDVTIDPWHILTSDEILLYHGGAPMIQMLLYADGHWEEIVLGPEVDKGQFPQKVIPAGTWMGFVKKEDPHYDWGLYGVMVAPAWHIEDIRMVEGKDELKMLREKFPTAVKRGKELGLF
ncbi:MAG: cupin domain-containing protein [Deltaproteobacteria bacterium]|nr:cupin domain-containing protein [Deltaproteobacteria bacterium]